MGQATDSAVKQVFESLWARTGQPQCERSFAGTGLVVSNKTAEALMARQGSVHPPQTQDRPDQPGPATPSDLLGRVCFWIRCLDIH